MPELPEVETVRSYLDDVVKGRKIVSVDVLLPRLIKTEMPMSLPPLSQGVPLRR